MPRLTRSPVSMPFDPLNLHRFSARLFDRTLPIRFMLAAALAAALALTAAQAAPTRGPENIADVAEQVIDAVVNISTSQKVDARMGGLPDLPPGSPLEEFFDEFFKNRRGGQGGQGGQGDQDRPARRVNSLGSGFIIDSSGIV